MDSGYDVIVVGARCAGSPTAMLLARQGLRVLLLDRAAFPSDTISTHVLHPTAAARLARWGLLERVAASGCPPIHTYSYDFGPLVLAGAPGTGDLPPAYCPRRTVLDKILVDGAVDSGAELRERFVVDEIVSEEGRVVGIRGHAADGGKVELRADIVVGADGRSSRVADVVQPRKYNERPPILANYYAYWSGVPAPGRFEIYLRERRGFALVETNDGLTLIVVGWPYAEFEANRADIEASFLAALDLAPPVAERVRAGKRATKFFGAAVPNFFRDPYGPGWVLVGDAGYEKDPITAYGIRDAFRDAELVSTAIVEHLKSGRDYGEAMSDYQRARDADAVPMFEMTCQLASLEPPAPRMQELLGAVARSRFGMDGFARMNAGTISPGEFFAPENIQRIQEAAQAG
jgi:flavin-dependent dehydrogenase